MSPINNNAKNEEMPTIKEICQRFSLSQAALSRRFDIPIRTVEDWHAGRRTPPDYVVRMIIEILEKKT